jgi:superfamily II DNA/RNA helicase
MKKPKLPKWLVLTEHEARGLDLPNVSAVFILGPASSPSSYLHMAGRAGRAGKPGTVISLLGGPLYERKFKIQANVLKLNPSRKTIE